MTRPHATRVQGRAMNSLGRWVGQLLKPAARDWTQADDWALWKAACAGDERSASRLVHGLTPQAFGLAMQMLARREDAEDAVQEAFLRLWNSHPSDACGATLATYFNTIVINRCRSWLTRRHEWSTPPDELAELADARQDTLALAPDGPLALDATRLQAAMARLPARQRMALAMWAYADADVTEIARAMELAPNAAHQLLYRAKKALRHHMQEPV